VQIALTIAASVLKAGDFGNCQLVFMHTQVDKSFDLKAITLNKDLLKAIFPKSIVTVAQVSEACTEKSID
jgi:hypothetical protein